MNEDLLDDEYEMLPELVVSECCGSHPLGGTSEDCYGHITGICSSCKDFATFVQEVEDERSSF